MEIIGYLASALIGISLGLIGGGGSILTVPVLVYLFHIDPTLATAYSLFVVGTTALVGGVRNYLRDQANLKTAFVFAVPGLIAVFITRRFIVPALPTELYSIGEFTLTRSMGIMLFFALLMVAAAVSMIRSKEQQETASQHAVFNYPMIILEGLTVGLLTGIVGAGGGFLIIPALVLFAKLPMKLAVGTSLIIIAINSLIGFTGDIASGQPIEYLFLMTITAIAMVGIFVGIYISRFISGSKLKIGFGWFVMLMALYIIIKEVLV